MVYTRWQPNWQNDAGGGTPIVEGFLDQIESTFVSQDGRLGLLEGLFGFRPEAYAANAALCGNGITDDTDAFVAMATAINALGANGKAVIVLRPNAIYRVGRQTFAGAGGGTGSYLPVSILPIFNIRWLVIAGNGATVKFNDGLRIGLWDPVTANTVHGTVDVALVSSGNTQYVASPGNVFTFTNVKRVTIRDLDLDGNDVSFIKGGAVGVVGTTDYSVAASGVLLTNCNGLEADNVHVHHMPLDGISFDDNSITVNNDGDAISLRNTALDYCGRNQLWLSGCGNVHAVASKFNHASRSMFATAPSVGIDFEAYSPNIGRDAVFESCEFADNKSRGYSVSSGWKRILFKRCLFRPSGVRGEFATIGGSTVAHEDCRINGMVNLLGSDPDDVDTNLKPLNATQFRRCTFEDLDFITPITFLDNAGIPTMRAEAKQSYGTNTALTQITAITGTGSNGTNLSRWRCQVLYNGTVVEDYNNLNTVAGTLPTISQSRYVTFTNLASPSTNPTSQPAPVIAVTLPASILDRSNIGFVAKAIDNALFEDCTFIPHAVTAFNISTNSGLVMPMTIRRCTVVIYNSAIAANANQSLLKQSYIDGLTFIEAPAPVNEIQTIAITGTPAGGTFTLSLWGFTTAALAITAAAPNVQSALETIFGAGNITVTGAVGGPYAATFTGIYAGSDIAPMVSANTFTGGTLPKVTVTTTTQGRSGLTPATGWFIGTNSTVILGPTGITVGPTVHWATATGVIGVVRNSQTPQFWGPFAPSVTYSQGDLVTNGGHLYAAITNFIASATFFASNWTQLI